MSLGQIRLSSEFHPHLMLLNIHLVPQLRSLYINTSIHVYLSVFVYLKRWMSHFLTMRKVRLNGAIKQNKTKNKHKIQDFIWYIKTFVNLRITFGLKWNIKKCPKYLWKMTSRICKYTRNNERTTKKQHHKNACWRRRRNWKILQEIERWLTFLVLLLTLLSNKGVNYKNVK